MRPKTRPRPGFHGVIGTPLYSWMKLNHSSNTYAAMTPVVARPLVRTLPNCDVQLRPAAWAEPAIEFTFSVPIVARPTLVPAQACRSGRSECNRKGYSRPCVVTPHAIEDCFGRRHRSVR